MTSCWCTVARKRTWQVRVCSEGSLEVLRVTDGTSGARTWSTRWLRVRSWRRAGCAWRESGGWVGGVGGWGTVLQRVGTRLRVGRRGKWRMRRMRRAHIAMTVEVHVAVCGSARAHSVARHAAPHLGPRGGVWCSGWAWVVRRPSRSRHAIAPHRELATAHLAKRRRPQMSAWWAVEAFSPCPGRSPAAAWQGQTARRACCGWCTRRHGVSALRRGRARGLRKRAHDEEEMPAGVWMVGAARVLP